MIKIQHMHFNNASLVFGGYFGLKTFIFSILTSDHTLSNKKQTRIISAKLSLSLCICNETGHDQSN